MAWQPLYGLTIGILTTRSRILTVKDSSTIQVIVLISNARVNVLISNSEWRIPTTQSIGWHPIIEVIPSIPKMGQKDEIVWLDSPNHRFSVKVAWEHLRFHDQVV